MDLGLERMTQLELGDQLAEAERRKAEGMARAADTSEDWLAWARREAVRLSAKNGQVSAVEIRALCERDNYWPPSPNAWGSLFKLPGWEHVDWRKAEHAQGHARHVKVWRYVGSGAHLRR